MAVTITWFGHASFMLTGSKSVAIDPWKLPDTADQADVVVVSHAHYDHCSPPDVRKVSGPNTTVFAPPDCLDKLSGKVMRVDPGQTCDADGVTIECVPAYNIDKEFHPRANNWIGAVVQLDGKRIYYAGDTDLIPEMGKLQNIDLALLPVGGTYTMSADEAAQAVGSIKPAKAMPYHWGDIVGSHSDAERFRDQADCEVVLLTPGTETILE